MSSDFPAYKDLNITDYPLTGGYYTLGIIKHHRPDIELITRADWVTYDSYDWLEQKIRSALARNKNIGIFIWDEDVSFDSEFAKTINKFRDQPVYVITQLDDFCMLNYKDQGITNILEVPWWLLNDCLTYYKLCSKDNLIQDSSEHNFLCMINRTQEHKLCLIDRLTQYTDCGIITTTTKYKNVQRSELLPYPKLSHKLGKTTANSKINDIWVSGNVENFLKIEEKYRNIPLIINPDTSVGLFQMTEKTVWPLLLGKMMMIAGRHNIMKSMQRFYDVDFSLYLNLDFDSSYPNFTQQSAELRITSMINDNVDLIRDAHSIYTNISSQLEAARWTLGKNFYNFFVSQIKKIPQRSSQ
jgi:hypothetical protein